MNKLFFILIAATLIATTGCTSDEPEPNDKPYVICPTAIGRNIIDAQNSFSCGFFKLASSTATAPNLVISPLSISMALSMTANGASGETLSEMTATLGGALDDMNSLNHLLLQGLPMADSKVALSLANSIWIDEAYPVLPTFVDINKNIYSAEVSNVDLDTENARRMINSWAKKQTKGLIPEFLTSTLPSTTRLMLINALYFKGPWAEKFNKNNTRDEIFTNADGSKSTVRMMSNSSMRVTAWTDGEDTLVNLPYGNGAFSMTLILPAEGCSAEKCIENITPERISSWQTTSHSSLTAWVKLPKFDIEFSPDNLIEILRSMGIRRAFTSEADFDKMAEKKLFIGLVKQKARLIVDEEGTEAAAVSGTGMLDAAFSPMEKPNFHFDRPFVFFISEQSTSSILFMGKVTKL